MVDEVTKTIYILGIGSMQGQVTKFGVDLFVPMFYKNNNPFNSNKETPNEDPKA